MRAAKDACRSRRAGLTRDPSSDLTRDSNRGPIHDWNRGFRRRACIRPRASCAAIRSVGMRDAERTRRMQQGRIRPYPMQLREARSRRIRRRIHRRRAHMRRGRNCVLNRGLWNPVRWNRVRQSRVRRPRQWPTLARRSPIGTMRECRSWDSVCRPLARLRRKGIIAVRRCRWARRRVRSRDRWRQVVTTEGIRDRLRRRTGMTAGIHMEFRRARRSLLCRRRLEPRL